MTMQDIKKLIPLPCFVPQVDIQSPSQVVLSSYPSYLLLQILVYNSRYEYTIIWSQLVGYPICLTHSTVEEHALLNYYAKSLRRQLYRLCVASETNLEETLIQPIQDKDFVTYLADDTWLYLDFLQVNQSAMFTLKWILDAILQGKGEIFNRKMPQNFNIIIGISPEVKAPLFLLNRCIIIHRQQSTFDQRNLIQALKEGLPATTLQFMDDWTADHQINCLRVLSTVKNSTLAFPDKNGILFQCTFHFFLT